MVGAVEFGGENPGIRRHVDECGADAGHFENPGNRDAAEDGQTEMVVGVDVDRNELLPQVVQGRSI